MISVIIPTRNRPTELFEVLNCIALQTTKVAEVLIIDSSDTFSLIAPSENWGFTLRHLNVSVKSAAVQRNIGMDLISGACEFLCFLDDDVQPDPNYVSQLMFGLRTKSAVGISGIALNPLKKDAPRGLPSGFYGTAQRIFGLDSHHDGKLLSSGVNIPIRVYGGDIQEVEWLIGCSLWRYQEISDLRFEPDFMGQSLSEDVIFSVRARERGRLFVDPKIHLAHTESAVGRPQGLDFWSMWVVNRKRVVEVALKGSRFFIRFHFANLGQFISLIYGGLFMKRAIQSDFMGIPLGYWRLIKRRRSS